MKQFSTHAGPPRSKMLLRLFVKIQSFFATASNKLSFALAKLNVGGKAKLNGGEFLGSQHSLYLAQSLGLRMIMRLLRPCENPQTVPF